MFKMNGEGTTPHGGDGNPTPPNNGWSDESMEPQSGQKQEKSDWESLMHPEIETPAQEENQPSAPEATDADSRMESASFEMSKEGLDLIREEHRLLLAEDLEKNGKGSRSFKLFAREGVEILDMKDPRFNGTVDQESYWQEDRLRLQQESIARQYAETAALSKSLRAAERKRGVSPTIYVMRGLSGSGKTHACKTRFEGMLFDETGEPIGTLAPDNSKKDLYKAGGTSDQIHKESSSMYRRLRHQISQEAVASEDGFSEIHDRVMDDVVDIMEVIQSAQETRRNVNVLDIDVPYMVSAIRVLQRPKDAPCPNYEYLERTFKSTRLNREKIIEELRKASSELPAVDYAYALLCYDYKGQPKQIQKEAARFIRDEQTGQLTLQILDENLYHTATRDTDEEIEEVKNAVIDEAFVDAYCQKFFGDDPESQAYAQKTRKDLEQYTKREQKITIYDALAEKNKK